MMYAFWGNLPKAIVLSFVAIVCFFILSSELWAEPYANPENNPGKHSYGPDQEGKQKQLMTGNSGMIDAYGNPVVPYEEEKKSPRYRLRSGAYSGDKPKENVRPLPDGHEQDAGWDFK